MQSGGFKLIFNQRAPRDEFRGATCAKTGFFAGLVFLFLLSAPAARAETELSFSGGWIPDEYVMTAEKSPYIVNTTTLRVSSSSTVTMEPGAVIKFRTGLRFPGQIIVYGTFRANGTEENPVVITSDKDDEYGGDTNADGSATSPSPGDWNRVDISGGTLDAQHLVMRYGGKYKYPALLLSSSSQGKAQVSLDNSIIEHSAWDGIKTSAAGCTLSVTNSVIRYNAGSGVRLQNSAIADILGTTFTENKYGFLGVGGKMVPENLSFSGNSFFGNTGAGFFYAGHDLPVLDLSDSWWGSSLGPTHPDNPAGDGDVVESSSVLFDPWISVDPALPPNNAPVLSYVSDEGYTSDGVEPNISFVNESFPVFKVAFSDDDEDAAQYVRLVVDDDAYAMATSTDEVFEFTPDAGVFDKGEYSYYFEASDGTDTARLPEEGELSFEVRYVPVILVPGIMGTELWKVDDKIWPDIGQMLWDRGDDFMDVLIMDANGNSIEDIYIGDALREPIENFYDIFNGLINDFSNAGYSENTDLFVFPYDWRLDIRTSAQTLKDKIDTILDETGSRKVDIIAHSMGGLLTKQYILDNSSSSVNKIIFVGTPHLGATQAAKTLLFGDNLNMKIIFPFLSANRVKYISQNMPAIYELLPSREYIDQSSYYYYDHTQSDVFDFDRTTQFLEDSGLNPILLENADEFHSNGMDNFDASGIDAYNINGCNTPTITTIMKRSMSEYSAFMFEGDGTVPLASSKSINTPNNKTYYFNNISHSTMPSANGIKDLIISIITGNEIIMPSNATHDSSQCVVAGKLVSVHSPVNLHIYDSEGNHVGRGENGDIEYEISGVAYEEIGENKFVFLPESGEHEYRIELDGTGDGLFSLRVSKVESSEVSETAYYSDIPVNESSDATVTLSENVASTVLQVDEEGSGNFETMPVSSVLNSEQSEDTTKPSTTISVSGGTNSANFILSATDDNSGILKTEYSLDNGQTWINYSDTVIINNIRSTEVLFRSKDRAGNLEACKTEIIKVSPAAIVLPPTPSAPIGSSEPSPEYPRGIDSGSGSETRPQQNDFGAGSELDSGSVPDPKVLGQKTERVQGEKYIKDDILTALSGADTETLLDYLGRQRDIGLESSVAAKHEQLGLGQAGINFIVYGTKNTQALGMGERAGVLYSFKEAFNRLPETNDDWNDVIRISTGQIPIQRSAEAEQRANNNLTAAYGIRPEKRDFKKEVQGIAEFVKIYGRVPGSTSDWNILRSIVY